MECKLRFEFIQLQYAWELIDTLWNVNGVPVPGVSVPGVELIDTLWNVNGLPHKLW